MLKSWSSLYISYHTPDQAKEFRKLSLSQMGILGPLIRAVAPTVYGGIESFKFGCSRVQLPFHYFVSPVHAFLRSEYISPRSPSLTSPHLLKPHPRRPRSKTSPHYNTDLQFKWQHKSFLLIGTRRRRSDAEETQYFCVTNRLDRRLEGSAPAASGLFWGVLGALRP